MSNNILDLCIGFCLGVALTMIVLRQHSGVIDNPVIVVDTLTPTLECNAGYQHYKRTGNTDRLSDECLADMR